MPKRHADHMKAQRERILHAAIVCIGDLGLEGCSMSAICAQSHLSVGAIYKHFSGKDEIIAEALRSAAMTEAMLPEQWPALRAELSELNGEGGFDPATLARTNLQLLASSLRPGPLQEVLRQSLSGSLSLLAKRLSAMSEAGQVRLRMSPEQTAACITALVDGLAWIGLARDMSRDDIREAVIAGLDCLVEQAPSYNP